MRQVIVSNTVSIMSVPILHLSPKQLEGERPSQNEFGETPLAYAPTIRLSNGDEAVPQQYLDVDRKLDNLSKVLNHISVPKGYQLFAGQDGACLYLIVGVIGKENYPRSAEIAQMDKMVYGRRWLIEPTTPTSEIVQTSLLAIKKVREHEVRELLTLRINNASHITTPFNCHLDMPLMAGNKFTLAKASALEVKAQLPHVKFAGYRFEIANTAVLGGKRLFELQVLGRSSHFPELENSSITVVCEHLDKRDFLHQLIATLIARSDRYVEENIAFMDFKRFSHDLDPIELAKFSYQTRNVEISDSRFEKGFEDMSYKVDASKAPLYNDGELGQKQRLLVASYKNLGGYLPLEK